ncbi:hypothetical protein TCON_1386 [Astathelohania contejeani]|uniref:Uncharacterized protein n=1 Tax=Astathelohania contejeani TaxID=164912 RepID=A0ABQ7HZ11_9MICR|nr:hypothetical protein TCON_1386 [Thelohania contejeani]
MVSTDNNNNSDTSTNTVEVYTVDHGYGLLVYGGISDICHFTNMDGEDDELDCFGDSIIYSKITSPDEVVVVSLNGIIVWYDPIKKSIIERIDLGEDISFATSHGSIVYCGGNNGMVFKNDMVITNHGSMIVEIVIDDDTVYSLSQTRLIAINNYKETLNVSLAGGTAFLIGPLICVGFERDVKFYRLDGRMLKHIVSHNFETYVETICHVNECYLVGGRGNNMLIINFKTGTHIVKCMDGDKPIRGISRIKKYRDTEVVFSTFCGRIGIGDYRTDFKYIKCGVGSIFDFFVGDGYIIIGGEFGIEILNI